MFRASLVIRMNCLEWPNTVKTVGDIDDNGRKLEDGDLRISVVWRR